MTLSAAACLTLGVLAARLAVAAYLSTSASLADLQLSARLSPLCSRCWAAIGNLESEMGRPASPSLLKAVEVDPIRAGNWIMLGLAEEQEGNAAAAEKALLRAADLDNGFLPAWTLANYYFRQSDPKRSLDWARRALTIGTGDLRGVFVLCWNQAPDPMNLVGDVIPARENVLVQYLNWLTAQGKLDAAAAIAPQVASSHAPNRRLELIDFCDAALQAGQIDRAIGCWNTTVRAGLLPGPELNPQSRPMIVNGAFASEPAGRGFDWHVENVEGVRSTPYRGGLRFTLSGDQPEDCVLLQQTVALQGPRDYTLNYSYSTAGIGPDGGIYWHVLRFPGFTAVPGEGGEVASDQPVFGHLNFRADPGLNLYRIALSYKRRAGTIRPSGSIQLSTVELEQSP